MHDPKNRVNIVLQKRKRKQNVLIKIFKYFTEKLGK